MTPTKNILSVTYMRYVLCCSMACNTTNPFFGNASCDIEKAVAAAKESETVVLCLGTTSQNDEGPSVDSEGHDEPEYSLPGSQAALADAVFAVGKPVILLLVNGGIVQIDDYAHRAAAVVEVPFLSRPSEISLRRTCSDSSSFAPNSQFLVLGHRYFCQHYRPQL